jgi:hypothetical protein
MIAATRVLLLPETSSRQTYQTLREAWSWGVMASSRLIRSVGTHVRLSEHRGRRREMAVSQRVCAGHQILKTEERVSKLGTAVISTPEAHSVGGRKPLPLTGCSAAHGGVPF